MMRFADNLGELAGHDIVLRRSEERARRLDASDLPVDAAQGTWLTHLVGLVRLKRSARSWGKSKRC